MSETDPYAAKEFEPNVEQAEFELPAVETSSEEPQNAPQTEGPVVPEGSIKDVLGWVGEDPTRAQAALDAETAGDNRKTLVKELNVILDK
jgi:hypothetical protein